MDKNAIIDEVQKLNPKSKKRFEANVFYLFNQFWETLILRRPYRLVLDSNVIMRLESYRKETVSEGLLSVFLFFDYFRESSFDADIVVMPSVFYEFFWQKNMSNTKEHWERFKNIKSVIEEELGLTVFFDDMETFAKASHLCELIEKDAKKIEGALLSYQKRDWQFNFVRTSDGFDGFITNDGKIEVPPYFAAKGLYKKLNLEYFNEELASRFLIEHMTKHLIECEDNDRGFVEKHMRVEDLLLTKILKLTNGKLKGLADIDILTRCNVQTQSELQAHGRYEPASIGLTIDKNLADALSFFSNPRLVSEEIIGGPDNLDDGMAKLEAVHADMLRIEEGVRRQQRVGTEQSEYLQEILLLID